MLEHTTTTIQTRRPTSGNQPLPFCGRPPHASPAAAAAAAGGGGGRDRSGGDQLPAPRDARRAIGAVLRPLMLLPLIHISVVHIWPTGLRAAGRPQLSCSAAVLYGRLGGW